MRLGSQVVDLIRSRAGDDGAQVGRVSHVTVVQEQTLAKGVNRVVLTRAALEEVLDTSSVERGRTSDQTMDDVSLLKQQLSKVRAILTSDTGDESHLLRDSVPNGKTPKEMIVSTPESPNTTYESSALALGLVYRSKKFEAGL